MSQCGRSPCGSGCYPGSSCLPGSSCSLHLQPPQQDQPCCCCCCCWSMPCITCAMDMDCQEAVEQHHDNILAEECLRLCNRLAMTHSRWQGFPQTITRVCVCGEGGEGEHGTGHGQEDSLAASQDHRSWDVSCSVCKALPCFHLKQQSLTASSWLKLRLPPDASALSMAVPLDRSASALPLYSSSA